MADALDSSNAGLYSPSSCHWCNIGSPKFAPARISPAEMVSSSAANSCTFYWRRPAPGELLQARALTSAVTTLHDFLLASPPRLQRFPPNMKSQSPFSLSPNISFPSSPGKTICHGRRSITAYWLGIVLVSVLFGYGHYYKRAAGIIYSGIAFFDLGSGIHGGGSKSLGLHFGSRIH